MQLNIREVELDDFDRLAELMRQQEPHEFTGDVLRQRHLIALTDGGIHERSVALNGDRIIAATRLTWPPNTPPGIFMIKAYVDKEWERQGIGRKLFEGMEQRAIELGAKRIICLAYEKNDRAFNLLDRAGYYLEQKLFESELNVQDASLADLPALKELLIQDGFTFVHYSDELDTEVNRRRMHHLMNETDKDTPGMEFWGLPSFEQFSKNMFEDPDYRADGVFFVEKDGEWIAMHHLEFSSPELCWVEFSGVLEKYRGKKLAYALKLMGLEWAKAQGARRMKTNNDTRNEAILHVNRKMGFAEMPGWLHMHKVLGE